MRHAKKVMLVPQEGRGPEFNATELNTQDISTTPVIQKKENSIRKYAYERELKRCKIILKLAAYGGYDELGRIKLPDGTFMEDSDIIPLLMHVLSPGRNIKGINEFVDLLHRAGVSPEFIINTSIRDMLMRRGTLSQTYTTPKDNSPREKSPEDFPENSPTSRTSKTIFLVNPRPLKRGREAIDESEENEVKRLRPDDIENRQLRSKRRIIGPSSVLRNKERKDNEVDNNQQENTNWSLHSEDDD